MEEIDIPEAIRESTELPKKSRIPYPIVVISILCGLALAGFFSLKLFSTRKLSAPVKTIEPQETVLPPQPPQISNNSKPDSPAQPQKNDLLGHLPYNVAPESELEAIAVDQSLKMRSPAAEKFKQMQSAARAEGIILVPISAFRDHQSQEQLFFSVKEQRGQDATKRAEVSAPPGYSEHHTGYAIDIGDANAPATNLEIDFANTAAFRWLEQNALKYSFELSFPPDNEQGVSYEPWHWRFVGDRHSLETFYQVRN